MSSRGSSTTPASASRSPRAAVAGVDPRRASPPCPATPAASSAADRGKEARRHAQQRQIHARADRDQPPRGPAAARRPRRAASPSPPGRRPRTTCRLVTATPSAIRKAEPTSVAVQHHRVMVERAQPPLGAHLRRRPPASSATTVPVAIHRPSRARTAPRRGPHRFPMPSPTPGRPVPTRGATRDQARPQAVAEPLRRRRPYPSNRWLKLGVHGASAAPHNRIDFFAILRRYNVRIAFTYK